MILGAIPLKHQIIWTSGIYIPKILYIYYFLMCKIGKNSRVGDVLCNILYTFARYITVK